MINKVNIDLSNEDPKVFTLKDQNYMFVISRRGFIINIFAIIFILGFIWIMILRIVYGECNGH